MKQRKNRLVCVKMDICMKNLLILNIIQFKAVKVALNCICYILIGNTRFYFCTFARILYMSTATSY